MKTSAYGEIVPINLRNLRQGIGVTQKTLGQGLAKRLFPEKTIPQTRINEWENNVRSTPAYIYTATAELLLELWSRSRKKVAKADIARIDFKFAKLLSAPLAEILSLEYELENSSACEMDILRVRRIRNALVDYLDSMLSINIATVFAESDDSHVQARNDET